MWVYLSDAYISITRHLTDPALLHVRARVKGDIEKVFPEAEVTETPDTDYRFRTNLPQELVERRIAEKVAGIGYHNFKATVKEHDRHDAYMDAFEGMVKLQMDRKRDGL